MAPYHLALRRAGDSAGGLDHALLRRPCRARSGIQPCARLRLLASLCPQLRHLARIASWELDGAARVRALKGLIAGTIALGGKPGRTVGEGFEAARTRKSRRRSSPMAATCRAARRHQLRVLLDLIDIRSALRAAQIGTSDAVGDAIERMAPMLRLFRHGDRRLALFNDSIEEDGVLIDLVLTRSETKGRAPMHAPDSGFERLQAGNSLVVVDTGKPSPAGFDEHAHAGALSFEMSHERERIVVN